MACTSSRALGQRLEAVIENRDGPVEGRRGRGPVVLDGRQHQVEDGRRRFLFLSQLLDRRAQDRARLVVLLGLEQDVRAGDDGRWVGRIDLEHVIELGQGRGILALLPVEVSAPDALVVGRGVLGIVQERGDFALGGRPLSPRRHRR